MIKDVTGTELTPGRGGINCMGNGLHTDENGNAIECCCDECDYAMCCTENFSDDECAMCDDPFCPNVNRKPE